MNESAWSIMGQFQTITSRKLRKHLQLLNTFAKLEDKKCWNQFDLISDKIEIINFKLNP